MKILVVNWLDRENPQAGGAEIHLHEVFGRIARSGHDVTVLSSGWPGCAPVTELDGMEVQRAGRRLTFSLAGPRHYRRRLRERGFDVIVEDLNKVPLFTGGWGPPVVLLVHHLFGGTAFQEASLPVAAATWVLERPIPRAYRDVPVIAISRSTADDLVARGISRQLITVIPNGIDLELYTPDPEGVEFPDPSILYLGRLKKYKRIDLVLRAVQRLRARGTNCRLRIAGGGDHRPRLEALSRELGIDDVVTFEGYVPEDRKVELFRRSWVHVLTSPKEGWGIANLEAAACGTPTVASDSPGLRDSVVDGTTGFLVRHGDVEELADRIGRLLGERELRDRMAREARAFAEGFSWEESARQTAELLAERVAAAPGLR